MTRGLTKRPNAATIPNCLSRVIWFNVMERNPIKVVSEVRSIAVLTFPDMILIASVLFPPVSPILSKYSERICMSSVEPITTIREGTITVSTLRGISTQAIKPAVQTILVPAVSMGNIAPLAERMNTIKVNRRTKIAIGTSLTVSSKILSLIKRRV